MPKQCEYNIALEFNSYLHVLFAIGQIFCYIHLLRTLSKQFISLNYEISYKNFRTETWQKVKKLLVLGLELGFL